MARKNGSVFDVPGSPFLFEFGFVAQRASFDVLGRTPNSERRTSNRNVAHEPGSRNSEPGTVRFS
jgi:hypothetical protein